MDRQLSPTTVNSRTPESSQLSSSDALHYVANAESFSSFYDEKNDSPAPKAVRQGVMLLLGLCAYTFGPVLVNWSVIVNVPPSAESTMLAIPARVEAHRWFGVALNRQPGMTELYVKEVFEGGLASAAGVLPGDIVSRGEQEGVVVFDKSSLKNQDYFVEVRGFIENPPNKSYPRAKPPLIQTDKPVTVTFDMEHVDVRKGDPYLGCSIVLMRNVIGATTLMLIYLKFFEGSLAKLYTPYNIAIIIFPALGWTCSDLFEMLANGKMNAASYSVISQSTLVVSALLMRILLGTRQSPSQMTCLVSLTIVILCYIQVRDSVPIGQYWNGFGTPWDPNDQKAATADSKGIPFALAKVGLSIILGVACQKILQKEELKSLPLVGLLALIWSLGAAAILPVMLVYMWRTNWDKGVFGGYPVELRHCMKAWDAVSCDSRTPVLVEQGWDYRTVVVLFFYIFRNFASSGVLRGFSALAKNLVNASSTVSTYFLSLALLGKEFNFSKCALTICIMLHIVQYARAPKDEELPQPSERRIEPSQAQSA